MKWIFFFLSIVGFSQNILAKCNVPQPEYIGDRQCYNTQIFDHVGGGKKNVMQKFAPMALYMQEITGYPASVIMAHLVKESGWKISAKDTSLFGIAGSKKGSESFAASNGQTFKVNFNGKSGNWQGYENQQNTFLGYIYWILYADNGYYSGVRRAIPSHFPPPADRATLIKKISSSGWCGGGCHCSLGGGKTGTYEQCMNSIVNSSCSAFLDNMVLCDYNYPILTDLPPLHKNIRPSKTAGGGSATLIRSRGERGNVAPGVGL